MAIQFGNKRRTIPSPSWRQRRCLCISKRSRTIYTESRLESIRIHESLRGTSKGQRASYYSRANEFSGAVDKLRPSVATGIRVLTWWPVRYNHHTRDAFHHLPPALLLSGSPKFLEDLESRDVLSDL